METKKRVKHTGFIGGTLIALILFVSGSCNWGVPDYGLTVIIEEGVTGTPEAGNYVHKELYRVEFSYTAVNPLHTVEVLINSTLRKQGEGSQVLYGDGYILTARLVDIRGVWNVKVAWPDFTTTEFSITISGEDLLSGTFADNRGYNGVWSAASNILTLTYSDWSDFIFTGTVFGMEGTYTGEEMTGNWAAQR